MIQPITTSDGHEGDEERGPVENRSRSPARPPRPTVWASTKMSPAAATIHMDAQNRPVLCCPTCVATQRQKTDHGARDEDRHRRAPVS